MPSPKSPSRRPLTRQVPDALAVLREAMRLQHEEWLDAHSELIDARNHLQQLYNEAPSGLATLTPSGVVLELNDTAAALIGGERASILGKPLLVFVQQSDAAVVLEHLSRCRAGVPLVVTELPLRYRQQPERHVQITSRRAELPSGPVYYTSFVDISARRQAEAALRSSEKLYRDIVETANEGICIVNVHNRMTFVNQQFARMVRTDVDALLGHALYELLPEADVAQAELAFSSRADVREPKEMRLRRADGGVIWVGVSTTLLHDDSGRFSGMLHMFADLTDRKEHDAERERLVAQLVTAQEAERRRIARELHDQIGQHITGFSLTLKRLSGLAGVTPEMRDLIARLTQLTETMSRDVHHVALELRPTALDDLGLPDALSHYADDVRRRTGIDIDVHCDVKARLQPTAETVIYRIAQEALTNVVKHAKAERVSVLLERRGKNVQLIIEDDGCGFLAERVLRFNPLEQRLGLAGMIERAALIKGELHIDSAPGRGTTLILRVSAAHEAPSNDQEITSATG